MAEDNPSPRSSARPSDVNKGCPRDAREGWHRGPRSLFLRRCENGFGFTLRHFIVYPPESYTVLAGDRRLGLRAGALDEPMDTIFVKNVRPNSPASVAGLATGDRIVSVNGQTISGRSYAQVVQLIHQSPSFLHLLVVPKEDDILQLYFSETAHHPETNQRPRLRSPEMVTGAQQQNPQPNQSQHNSRLSVHQRQLPSFQNTWDDVRYQSPQRGVQNRRASSESYTMAQTESSNQSSNYGSSESVPSSAYAYPGNTPGCRLSLDAGLIGRHESSHDGSASSLDSQVRDAHSSDDSIIMSRFRKSFEQKEEFMKRPTAMSVYSPSNIKEFYARPQKLQGTLWPPNVSSPNHSPGRQSDDETSQNERDFICGGAVTNIPNQDLRTARAPRSCFVTTLGRIQENAQSLHSAPPQLTHHTLVSTRAKQFERGCVDNELPDRTSLYKSELARLSAKRNVPNVAVRKREFEAKSDKIDRRGFMTRESRSLDSAGNLPNPALSGNRAIPVGGSKLHCEPPADYLQQSIEIGGVGPSLRPRSNSAESCWLGDSWPQRHKAVRQDSYLAACRKPVGAAVALVNTEIRAVTLPEEDSPTELQEECNTPSPKIIPQIRIDPIVPQSKTKPLRPTKLDIPNPIRPASDVFDDRRLFREALEQENSSIEDDSTSTPLSSPGVIWRDKTPLDPATEDERATRRVSYLKATGGDRMHVDSDAELSDTEPNVSVLGTRHSTCDDDLVDKENHQTIHEGTLHVKLTVVDGKRAGDRSWKQVWAVLRGPVLCLYKERRDSLSLPETPVNHEVTSNTHSEQIDVHNALVAAADDYTKRKHVLRLGTLSGSELLLQAQDASHMARWLVALQEQANNNNNTQGGTNNSLSPVATHKGIKKLTSFRNRSPTGQSPVNKTRKPSQTEQPLSSPKSKTWKGRVAKQLRRIQQGAGSPTTPHASYPEGATIGIPLELCPQSNLSEYVPLLVELCTSIVERRGLEIIGIYRVPGNTAAVSSLTESVNKDLDAALLEQSDVNVISSLLKSFFRRLPDSLLTTELYPSFIQADKIEDPHLRIATIRKLVHDLPDHHYETLKYLLFHLKKVVEHCVVNKMEARNLAIVFGPTLVRAGDDNMVTMVTDMSHQCRIVETLILHVDWCFGDETVDRLCLNPAVDGANTSADADSAVGNHNLLLGNIHKVEGMKSDKEVTAKDIVSSIICAANRKMQKAKARKSTSSPGEDNVDHHIDVKQRTSKSTPRKERLSSVEDTTAVETTNSSQSPSSVVASGIRESIVFSGNIANKLPSENDYVAGQVEPRMIVAKPVEDDGSIRTYTGLSATTQERIRRFELETKAMLHRDGSRSRRDEKRDPEKDKERIDREWQQAKRELEADDLLDRIADNPSAIAKKIVESGKSKLPTSNASKPLAIVSPSTAGTRSDSSRWGKSKEVDVRKKEETGLLRRGSSAENLNILPSSPQSGDKLANYGNLKRFKANKEQGELVRCGSLDSLHDVSQNERPSSHISDEAGRRLGRFFGPGFNFHVEALPGWHH
uniref:Rho GTPase-activating protein 21 n=1 Tax=Clastoptera arizonana TaxID=38151 RepID=A0A1B6CU09_9HEMI